MTTSNTNNQGIVHVAHQFGGRPFCKSRRAIMVTIPAEVSKWPRVCVRCETKLNQMQARAKAKAN